MIGLCYICHAPAVNTCRFCGRSVCKDHYDAGAEACVQCLRGKKAGAEG